MGDVCKQDITETGVFGVTVAKFTSVPLDCPLTKGTITLSSHAETIDVLPDWFPAEPVQTNFRVKTSAGKEMVCLDSTLTPVPLGGFAGKGTTPIVVGLAGVIGGLLGVAVGVVAGDSLPPHNKSNSRHSWPESHMPPGFRVVSRFSRMVLTPAWHV